MKHFILIALTITTFAAQAADSLVIVPAKFALNGSAARQQLLVEQFADEQFVGQITNAVMFSSSDTNLVRIENDVALPVANGTATIRAKLDNRVATAQVKVTDMDKPFEWSFRNHVQPVLAK